MPLLGTSRGPDWGGPSGNWVYLLDIEVQSRHPLVTGCAPHRGANTSPDKGRLRAAPFLCPLRTVWRQREVESLEHRDAPFVLPHNGIDLRGAGNRTITQRRWHRPMNAKTLRGSLSDREGRAVSRTKSQDDGHEVGEAADEGSH